ncbi:hypothetical protein XELAEV_18026839mg [Xenopus laevis]|uniref:Uncharacterized protein n=1 Tax=Xenopus laevis TaxID=8355 RepID=A0A974CV44_XENLA|nr:hypothetical protein XELAEV_18026839mg [Xenopus laevis]
MAAQRRAHSPIDDSDSESMSTEKVTLVHLKSIPTKSDLADMITQFKTTLKDEIANNYHTKTIVALQRRLDDIDNRGCRNNLRIRGMPELIEGDNLQLFWQILEKPDTFTTDLERAHRALKTRGAAKNKPKGLAWTYPFGLQITRDGTTVTLASLEAIPQFCQSCGIKELDLSEWIKFTLAPKIQELLQREDWTKVESPKSKKKKNKMTPERRKGRDE